MKIPESRFTFMKIYEIKPTGWILEQIQRDLREGFAACLDQLTTCIRSEVFSNGRVDSFEMTPSGMIEDTPRTWWSGEQTAFWLDGLLRMALLADDREVMNKVDPYMEELLASQDQDGYIGIYTPFSRYKHTKENGEFWTQSRIFVAMIAYYEWTGKLEYLQAVERAAQLTMKHYGPAAGGRSYFNNEEPAGGTGHGLMFVEVMELLYELTGNLMYRDFGIWCYEDYCSAKRIRDTDNQLDNLLERDKPFNWHTPHTTEHLRVPMWISYVTGEPQYAQASENAFAKIKQYLVPSGACIGDECILEREPDPSLPYEYCSMTELTISLQSALQKSGKAEFGDMIEMIAFNAAQGARLPNGRAISYLTRDNRFEASWDEGHDGKHQYSPTHETGALCCAGQAMKYMPYYVNRMWMRLSGKDDGLAAVTYGPSVLSTHVRGVAVTIEQITEYPFLETITFRVTTDSEVEFPLFLRIPAWSKGFDVIVEEAQVTEEDGFVRIHKKWTQHELTLRLKAEVELSPAVNGEVAIRRGPLLYAQSIPEKRVITKSYEYGEFVDFNAVPADPEMIMQSPVLELARPNLGLSYSHEACPCSPWEHPPVRLTGMLKNAAGREMKIALVPIGSTILRRVTFPSR